jgi:hypothetical protein
MGEFLCFFSYLFNISVQLILRKSLGEERTFSLVNRLTREPARLIPLIRLRFCRMAVDLPLTSWPKY